MSVQPQRPQSSPNSRQFSLTLRNEECDLLERIAAAFTDGNRSRAVAFLIELYGGKALAHSEREGELQEPVAPFEVTRWAKPKLDERIIAYIAGLVRAGQMEETAFRMAGVSPRQRSSWMKQGRNDRAAGRQGLHADLVAAVERAEAECEYEDIVRLRKHGQTTWTALAWRLERQFPDRYAQRKRIDGTVQHSLMPMIDYDRLTPQETRTLVELLRKASPEADDPAISRSQRPALELLPADVVEEAEIVVDAVEAPPIVGDSVEAPALEADGEKPRS